MVTEGGEAAFVLRMIDESRSLGHIGVFSSLFGKFSSLIAVRARLVALEVRRQTSYERAERCQLDNYAVIEMQQGQTRRWAIAWSWQPDRFPDVRARGQTSLT